MSSPVPVSVESEPLTVGDLTAQKLSSSVPLPTDSSVITGPIRRTLFFLAMPVLAEQVLNTMVGLVDVYLAGRISASATAAVGLSAYVSWFVSLIVMLIATGTTAVVARLEGAGDHAEANHFANQSLTLAAILGMIVCPLMYMLAPWFTAYCRLTGDAETIAVTYLRTEAFGHVAFSMTLVGCAAFRGVGNMRTPMVIFAAINVVNVVTSCGLVYGWGPLPEVGVNGIVGGTVIARYLGAILTVILLVGGKYGLRLHARELSLSLDRAARVLRIGIPAAADGAVMWMGQFVFIAIISRLAPPPMGEAYFAAHIIAVRTEALTYLPAVAWAAATATMIGQALGAGDSRRAIRVGHEGVMQCGLLSLGIAVFFFFGASLIYQQMSTDEAVRAAGTDPFRVLALLQPCMVVSIVYIGGLRGAGDTRYPLLITLVGAILIRVPLGYYFGVVCRGGLFGAWIGMFGDMIWRAVGATIRYHQAQWIKTRL